MKLFDECIIGVDKLISAYPFSQLSITTEDKAWQDEGKNQLIFKEDMAYELGGDTLSAISGIAVTDNAELIPSDEVLLIGKDLPDLKQDVPYARIALVRMKDEDMGDASAQYKKIRKVEYTRYHVSPKGFMMRISAMNQREAVRVSEEALKEGLNFAKVGGMFLKAYHEHPSVEAVKLIFITQPDFPYEELSKLMIQSENITKTLDHLLNKVNMDCRSCSLQEVCAEVEQLYNEEVKK